MNNLFPVLGVLAIILILVLIFLLTRYNSFIKNRNQVKTDFSDIDIQLTRRSSLIGKLVEIVQGYAKHEKSTFTQVTEARSALDNSKTVQEKAQADNLLTQTLKSIFMVVENYPELKANENYLQLQRDLKETEDNIAHYREDYNRSVQEYNNSIQTFPNLLAAFIFKFYEEDFFQTT